MQGRKPGHKSGQEQITLYGWIRVNEHHKFMNDYHCRSCGKYNRVLLTNGALTKEVCQSPLSQRLLIAEFIVQLLVKHLESLFGLELLPQGLLII